MKLQILGIVFLAGCASTPYDYNKATFTTDGDVNYIWSKVDGLDNLATTIEILPDDEVAIKCSPKVDIYGCAKINFEKWTCKIYTSTVVIEHEKKHCLGYSHRGDHLIQSFENWKASKTKS